MKDVAGLAGVSVQTVSNVINKRERETSAATQRKVLDAVGALNFHPNSAGRALRAQRSRTLGFVVLDPERRFLADPMTDSIVAGIGDVVRDRDYGLLIHAGRPDREEDELLDAIVQQRVDGVFLHLSGPPELRQGYVDRAIEHGTQVVVFESDMDGPVLAVTADNERAAESLVEHLAERGHRRIAFLASEVSWPMIEERLTGYRRALGRLGVAPDPQLESYEGGWRPRDGAAVVDRLLSLADPPTAIMAGNDLLAIGAIDALTQRGIAVPEQMAVTGFNDFDFAPFMRPRLTTVHVPGYEIGTTAAHQLIDALERKKPVPVTTHVLPVELRLRDST